MTAAERAKVDRDLIDALRAGYVRGLMGIPLTKDDVGLRYSELCDKYGAVPRSPMVRVEKARIIPQTDPAGAIGQAAQSIARAAGPEEVSK